MRWWLVSDEFGSGDDVLASYNALMGSTTQGTHRITRVDVPDVWANGHPGHVYFLETGHWWPIPGEAWAWPA